MNDIEGMTEPELHEKPARESMIKLQGFLERHNAERDELLYYRQLREVKDILLVANIYDVYSIEGEERLLDHFLNEYRQMTFSSPPRIIGVSNEEEAFEKLSSRRFDLVIIMIGSKKESQIELCTKIKNRYPSLTVYLLLNKQEDIPFVEKHKSLDAPIDNFFVWRGNPKVFSTMVRLLEDEINVENDVQKGFARVILLVEDSPLFYSNYLPMLYSLIMEQNKKLIDDDPTGELKIVKLRTRPKILFATTWESALSIFEKYQDNMLCVISDMSFSKGGVVDDMAGMEFVEYVKKSQPTLPVVLQSTDPDNAKYAFPLKCIFINKDSKTLEQDVKSFINFYLGFGNFVFRDGKGRQIATAKTLSELEKMVATIPDDSFFYHAVRNHFSIWLMARGEIKLSRVIGSRKMVQEGTVAEAKSFVINALRQHRREKNRGRIVAFDETSLLDETNVVSLAPGSLGGKGRGLAFVNTLIYSFNIGEALQGINIKTPITAIVGTDEFDMFMERNHLWQVVEEEQDFATLQVQFVRGSLSYSLEKNLKIFLRHINKPLAVRSSSLLEDSMSNPFSGIFGTYLLPNNHDDFDTRLRQLMDAIKLVFSSIYSRNARTYFEAIHYQIEQEKMAVVIQEVVGNRFEDMFYPHLSGTAQSFNYYPVAHITPEDGFSVMAVGLGQYVVEGERAFRFCPVYPSLDIVSQTDVVKNSQVDFFAVNLAKQDVNLLEGENAGLVLSDISVAERHKTLSHMVSVYDVDNDVIAPGLDAAGPRVVNFADILKYGYVPLASTIRTILDVVSEATGNPSEVEFAVDLTKDEDGKASFYLLQIKPLFGNNAGYEIDMSSIDEGSVVLKSVKSMGNGVVQDIRDVVFIEPDSYDNLLTVEMAEEIDAANEEMMRQELRYVLIGPGRWGTRDPFLGIPVAWPQISNAKVIVEVGLPGFHLDASLGSHFFHNVTSMNVGYFSIDMDTNSGSIDWDSLRRQEVIAQGKYVKHIRFKNPLKIMMDGKSGVAVISMNETNEL